MKKIYPAECNLVDESKKYKDVGDMWYQKNDHGSGNGPMLIAMVDVGIMVNITQLATAPQPWGVTGEPPNITVHPSIKMVKANGVEVWHGWIKNGEITSVN